MIPEVVKPKFGAAMDRESRGRFKMDLLAALADAPKPLLSVEVARPVGLDPPIPKSVAYHLLFLRRKGLVSQGRGFHGAEPRATWEITQRGRQVLGSATACDAPDSAARQTYFP